MTPQPEPLAPADWGFGAVVDLIATRDEAIATVHFFECLRETITWTFNLQPEAETYLPPLTDTDYDRARQFADEPASGDEKAQIVMRMARDIAINPVRRAQTLLALECHIAYLRGAFNLPEDL